MVAVLFLVGRAEPLLARRAQQGMTAQVRRATRVSDHADFAQSIVLPGMSLAGHAIALHAAGAEAVEVRETVICHGIGRVEVESLRAQPTVIKSNSQDVFCLMIYIIFYYIAKSLLSP